MPKPREKRIMFFFLFNKKLYKKSGKKLTKELLEWYWVVAYRAGRRNMSTKDVGLTIIILL